MFITEQNQMIQENARKIATEKIMPLAREVDERGETPWENIKLLGENGFFGVHIPEEYGGVGSDMLNYVGVVEEIAAACASTSVALTTQSFTSAPILIAGTKEQKKKYIPRLATGEVLGSFGITEPGAGSDASSIKTTAVKEGNTYRLNGQKTFITNAGDSEIYVFAVRTSEERTRGISLIIVEKDTPGLTFGKKEEKMGIRGSVTREVFLEDVVVPEENLIGAEGEGFKILMHVFNQSRPVVGAQATGIARGAYEYSLKYVTERKQFGQPLHEFQMVQSMLADMAMKIEAARLLVQKAIYMLGQDNPNLITQASMAKCFASDVAMEVTTDAVQLLGGSGYVKDYPVERMMRDAKITQIYEGTNQIQRIIIAKQLISQVTK